MEEERDPQSEQRFFIAVALSILIYFLFAQFVFEPPPPPAEGEATAAQVTEVTPQPTQAPAAPQAEVPPKPAVSEAPERSFDQGWAMADARWSSRGGAPSHLSLTQYREKIEQQWLPGWLMAGFKNGMKWERFSLQCSDPDNIDLVTAESGNVLLPVGTDSAGVAADVGTYEVVRSDPGAVVFRQRRGGLEVTKRYVLPADGYVLGYTVELRNTGASPLDVQPRFGVADHIGAVKGYRAKQRKLYVEVDGDVESKSPKKVAADGTITFEGEQSWVALADKYFMVGLEPEQLMEGGVVTLEALPGEDERYAAVLGAPDVRLAAGESRSYAFEVYAGPMVLPELKGADLRMASAIDFGILGPVALPILIFLRFIYSLIGSWGLSIVALTLVIKGLLFPLSLKSNKSMKAMSTLSPRIEALKEEYKDDPQALNTATMKLWKENGVNPAGGCLPMLVQMPIWFSLYRVLWNSVELYQSSFLYFCDLTLRDPIGILAVLYAVAMLVTQKMTPTAANMDSSQQKIMKFLPLAFAFMMFRLPAGLVLYILVSMTLGILERLWLNRSDVGVKASA